MRPPHTTRNAVDPRIALVRLPEVFAWLVDKPEEELDSIEPIPRAPRLRRSVVEAMRAAGGEVAPPPPQTLVRREVARAPATQATQAAPSPQTSVANVRRTRAEDRAVLVDAELEAAKTRFVPPPVTEMAPEPTVEPSSPALRGFPLGDYVANNQQVPTAPEPPLAAAVTENEPPLATMVTENEPAPASAPEVLMEPPSEQSAIDPEPTAWAESPSETGAKELPVLRPAFLSVKPEPLPPVEEPADAPAAEEVVAVEPSSEVPPAFETLPEIPPVAEIESAEAVAAAEEAATEPDVESAPVLNLRPPRLLPPPLVAPNRAAPAVMTRADDFLPSRGGRP